MRRNRLFFLLALLWALPGKAQQKETDTLYKQLDEVVFSYNKWGQSTKEVPNKVVRINLDLAKIQAPQTSADLLSQTGTVFVQKSQLGGGSPMIRGFATNRVLLVADGVRMNNAIYRSGNLQNVIQVDPLSLENAEVIFGPGSLIYGRDAIGGVMDFRTLQPKFSNSDNVTVHGSALARYSTANKEKTGHADFNIGLRRWAFVTSLSYSDFDDLKMGGHGPGKNYLRPEYVERQGNADMIVPNRDPRVQRFSGYDQLNFLQKVRFRASDKVDLQYSFTYAGTGETPRYDRLTQYRNGNLRFAEWKYGPMLWRVHHLQVTHTGRNALYDDARFIVAYQDYEESRIDRTRNNNDRHTQTEKVDAISFNWDARKTIGQGELFYGLEFVHNKVGSFGIATDISTRQHTLMESRYPNGSKWSTGGMYGSFKVNLHEKLTLITGLRYSQNMLKSKFDNTFYPFPYTDAKINEGALTGNLGLVYRPSETWQLNGNISTGYRMPNVDDIGKLFESTPGNLTVPNPDLKSEYAWNFEVGIVKDVPHQYRIELNGFHTILDNAIVRRPFTFNGQDSVLYDGELSQVEALQNVARATVWGLQASVMIYITPSLTFTTHANWIGGKETDDVKDEEVPLRHAPPFYGSSFLRYTWKKLFAEFSAVYNGEVAYEDLSPSEKDKGYMYAEDKNGNPYCPGWYTLNLKAGYQLTRNLSLSAGYENFTDQRYRPYSSGIVAAGANFIVSLRAKF